MLARLVERVMARRIKLGPATTGYRVTQNLTVPVGDGVELLADHYAPSEGVPTGTLLLRGPYGRRSPAATIMAGLYASRGYHVVIVSSRGTFGSGGTFDPGRHEVQDGAAAVEWLRGQDWFTGTFATVGGSYLGFTQWALLCDPPAELETCVITMGPHDFARAVWGTGSFALADFLSWAYFITVQHRGGWIRQLVRSTTSPRRLRPFLDEVPPAYVTHELLGAGSPWYATWLAHADQDDDYWRPLRLGNVFDRVRQPVFLIGGWQDLFVDQTIDQFRALRARGADVALLVGPWTHGEGGGAAIRASFDWLAGHRQPTPVRIFVTGGGGWRDLPDWPPECGGTTLYPAGNGELLDGPPATGASTFVFDPSDPTPTIGGRLLTASAAGHRNDTSLALRQDVVAFTGRPLSADLDVVGSPYVELLHTADTAADVFVRVSDVDPKGKSHNVTDGYVRLGERDGGPLRIELDPMAHRFRSSHRIRLLIAGGSFPRFARNLGTGEPLATGTRLVPSTHVVEHGPGTRLTLPAADAAPRRLLNKGVFGAGARWGM